MHPAHVTLLSCLARSSKQQMKKKKDRRGTKEEEAALLCCPPSTGVLNNGRPAERTTSCVYWLMAAGLELLHATVIFPHT